MDWDKMRVPKEELTKVRVRDPKATTPERQRALLRHLLGGCEASFIGKRNHSKVRVLMLLFNTQDRFLSAEQIAEESGISYDYCRNRLPLWFMWGYVNRTTLRKKFRRYAISKKGIRYLEKVPPEVAALIIEELKNYRAMAEHVKRTLGD